MSSSSTARADAPRRIVASLATVLAVAGLVSVVTAPAAAAADVPTFTMGTPTVTEPAGALDPTDTVRTVYGGSMSYPGLTSSGNGTVSLTATPASVCRPVGPMSVNFVGVGTCTIAPRSTGTAAFQSATGTPVDIPVVPAKTSVTASSQTVGYGSAPGAVTYTYRAYFAGSTPGTVTGGLATAPTCTTTATAASLPGVYPATCGGGADPNYAIRGYVAGTVTVTGWPLDVTAGPSRVFTYADPIPTPAPVYSGFRDGDTGPAVPPTCAVFANVSGGKPLAELIPPKSLGFTTFYVECSGGSDPKYQLRYQNGFSDRTNRAAWTMTTAALTATAPSPTIVYGSPDPTLVPTVTGLKAGDTPASVGISCHVADPRPLTVGTHVVRCGFSGTPNGNYVVAPVSGTLTVTPAEASATASSQTVAYGTAPAPVTPSYVGLANGDTTPATAPTCTTTATSTSLPGTYESVCSGASDPNYTVTSIKGSVTIVPAPVTVTASSQTVTYGTTLTPPTPTYSGLQNGDVAPATPATCSTTAPSSPGAGVYPVTCDGAADSHYAIDYQPGTVTVSRAPLTVTASSETVQYGQASGTITPSYAGLQNGDTAPHTAASCQSTKTSGSPVGTYRTLCSDAADSNYRFTYVDGTTQVTPAPLTITASSQSVVRGTDPTAVTATFDEVSTPQLAAAPTCSTTADARSAVGTYPTTCTGAADPNYAIRYKPGVATVTPTPLTITASSQTSVYGTAPVTVTAAYEGLLPSESAADVAVSCATTAVASSNVGSYPTVCSGAQNANYAVTYVNGTATVNKAPLATTASSQTVGYGDAPQLVTPTYDGLINGDVAPRTPGSCTTTATATSPVGTYPAACTGTTDPNYAVTTVPGTVTVTAAALSITASSQTVVYGNTPAAVTATYMGLRNGATTTSTPPTCSSNVTSATPVGTYPATCTGAGDPNYAAPSYVAGTVTVVPAPLSVTASSPTWTFGTTPAPVTPVYRGLVNGTPGPATAPTCSTTATTTSPVGTYSTTCVGAADPDYTVVTTPGTATVARAALTVTAASGTVTYGGGAPTLAPSYSGLVGGATAPTTRAVCATSATSASGVGTYPTTCAGAADPNYAVTYVAGTLTVSPAPVTVTASSQTIASGTAPAAVTALYTGLVNGDRTLRTAPTCSTTATSTSPAGTYPAACVGGADPDYTVTRYNAGVVTVAVGTPASVVVTSGGGQSTVTGSAFAAPLVATVHDTAGNAVPNAAVTFTVVAATGRSGTATFAGGKTSAVVTSGRDGTVVSPLLTAGQPGPVTVTATAAGAATGASFLLTAGTPGSARADLSVAVSLPAQAKPGSSVSAKVTVTNAGPYTATKTATAFTVPLGWKVTNAGGGSLLCNSVVLFAAEGLASGASIAYIVTLTASAKATTSTALAAVLSATIDPKLSNNAATASTSVR